MKKLDKHKPTVREWMGTKPGPGGNHKTHASRRQLLSAQEKIHTHRIFDLLNIFIARRAECLKRFLFIFVYNPYTSLVKRGGGDFRTTLVIAVGIVLLFLPRPLCL